MKRQRNIRKLLRILICLAAALVLAVVLCNAAFLSRGERIIEPADAGNMNADCILVLGAGIYGTDRPTPMLADRLQQGYELYQAGAAPKIVVSGDHGMVDYDETNTMKNWLLAKGVPSQDIFMDHAGFCTYDSMYRVGSIFGAEKVLVVSQSYHLYRALYIGDKLGLDVMGVSADTRHYAGQLYRELREIAARCKDALICMFLPEPALLGEPVELTGSGDVTNDRAGEDGSV